MHCLSPDRRRAMLAEQEGKCAKPGCGYVFDIYDTPRTYHIDHDHGCCPGSYTCGQCIRSLLCVNCNKMARSAVEHVDWATFLLSASNDREAIRASIKHLVTKLDDLDAAEGLREKTS
jgi:hypothetical protein